MKIFKSITAMSIAILLAVSGLAQPVAGEQKSMKSIEEFIAVACEQDVFSGTVLIASNDNILLLKSCGKSNREMGQDNNEKTKYNIASMGKMFTGVAIAQLAEAGKLSYDQLVVEILDELPGEIFDEITIEQLLTHTSGLGDIFDKPQFMEIKDKARSIDEYVQLALNEPLLFSPGTAVKYSNYGYILLGAVIEKISGQSYYDYVEENIFSPLEMNDSGFYESDSFTENKALGYASPPPPPPGHTDEAMKQEERMSNTALIEVKGTSAGGAYSTAEDLLKFSLGLQNHVILTKKSVEEVTEGKVKLPLPPPPPGMQPLPELSFGYGFGEFFVNEQRIYGHNGGAPGIDVQMDIYDKKGYTVIVLSNYDRSVMPIVQFIQKSLTVD